MSVTFPLLPVTSWTQKMLLRTYAVIIMIIIVIIIIIMIIIMIIIVVIIIVVVTENTDIIVNLMDETLLFPYG